MQEQPADAPVAQDGPELPQDAPAQRDESEDLHGLIWKQAQLLTATINILRGQPDELTLWSHHDIAEWAQRVVDERNRLREMLREIQS